MSIVCTVIPCLLFQYVALECALVLGNNGYFLQFIRF
jgi:hypothetical protein